jgi:hypothetical protein
MMTMMKGTFSIHYMIYLNYNTFTSHLLLLELLCSYTGLKTSVGQRDLRSSNRSAQGPKSKSQFVPKQGQGSKFVPRVSKACFLSVICHNTYFFAQSALHYILFLEQSLAQA